MRALGALLSEAGRFQEAQPHLRETVRIEADRASLATLAHLGVCREAAGGSDEARRLLSAAVPRLDPREPAAKSLRERAEHALARCGG